MAGERRWRASQKASLHVVPVIVRSLTNQEALELAIIENVQRSDLNAIEEAAGYRQLIDNFNYTQDELGQIIGKSRSHLANTMRLLKLPESVQGLVRDSLLSAGHARALVGHEDAEALAKEIVDKGLNVRQVEALVMGRKSGATPSTPKTPAQKDPDTRAAERAMSDALGLSVVINPGSGEAGEIVVRYHTPPGRPGYAPGAHSTQESDSVERSPRLRKLRVFPVPRDVCPDGAIFMGAHFKIARKGLVSPRMHYHDAGHTGKIYVGYIGKHLPNAHTN